MKRKRKVFALIVLKFSVLRGEENQRRGRGRRRNHKRWNNDDEVVTISNRRSSLDQYCTGKRKSDDVIIYLGQKQHSSYDATHANTLNASMASLRQNMFKISESDVIVWHEGDLSLRDANALQGETNIRFCLLTNATGWSIPNFIQVDSLPPMPWSLGYRKMIRFYAVTIWSTLKTLGYEWVMRMDDDSFILSPIPYNIFDYMRASGDLYAYRMLSAECPRTFGDFIKYFAHQIVQKFYHSNAIDTARIDLIMRKTNMDKDFVSHCIKFPRHCKSQNKRDKLRFEFSKLDLHQNPQLIPLAISRGMPYCAAIGQYGYYNNWFVTQIDWWLTEPKVKAMITEFDQSKLIFTHRSNDLIFQTAAIKLFMPPSRRSRFIDFTYQHHTTRHGAVVFGGIESGTTDPQAVARIQNYARKYGGTPRPCQVKDRFQTTQFQRIFYVVPGETSTAPFCSTDGNFI
mmetsp:Transcript_15017/g.22561  ORF Transcript_15017/g.22561 Transcript_15017/m.22561 type:complete len:457 (-) Transcript_15017:107-1477(-)